MLFYPLFLLTLLIRESHFIEHKPEAQGPLGEIVPSSTSATHVEASTKGDHDINMFVKNYSHPESMTESLVTTAVPGDSSKKIKIELEEPKESRESKDSKKSKTPKKSEDVEDTGTSTTTEKAAKSKQSEDPKECPDENLVCNNPLNENDTKQFDCDKKKCPKDFFCCKDNCFAHKICKEPSSSNGSFIRSSRIREVCPAIEEACLLPADIKNAMFCSGKENCTSGFKCCSDACFKRSVCKKPEILIEARVETCPEEPKTCNAFLRDIKIEPKYVCNVNMSNCPEDYKCCSDNCHNLNLCKSPEVHVVVKKLIPVTTYQNASQNTTGTVPGNQNATIPQPGNQNATSSPPTTQNTTVSQAGNQNQTTFQPGAQNTTALQTTTSQPENQKTTSSQPGAQITTVLQTTTSQSGNEKTSSQAGAQDTTVLQTTTSQPENQKSTSSQLGTQTTTVSQTPTPPPKKTVPETTSPHPGTQNVTTPKINDKNATSVEPLG